MRGNAYALNYSCLSEERTGLKVQKKAFAGYQAKLAALGFLVLLAAMAYLTINVNFENQKLMNYAFKLRIPKLTVMAISAFAIGGASSILIRIPTLGNFLQRAIILSVKYPLVEITTLSDFL